jgi:hypothetical protein
MRRLFWFGLGAVVGTAATRKYAQLREQLTWQVLLKSLASSVPVLWNSLRSIVVNAVRSLQTQSDTQPPPTQRVTGTKP